MSSAIHWKPLGKEPRKSWNLFRKRVVAANENEFVVCVPPCTGKVELSKKLVSNKQLIVIELDSFIRDVNDKELLERLDTAEKEDNNGLTHILYSMAASKALSFVREELSKDRKMKVVYLTSDFEWSERSFPAHQLYVAIPSRELHRTIVGTTPTSEHEKLDRQRTEFIGRLPYDAAKTFNTFAELEDMLRGLFDIQHRV